MKQYFYKGLTAAVILLGLIGFDQYTKYLAVLHLKGQADYVLIPNIFRLTYVENFGAAFGTMQNRTIVLLLVTSALLLYLLLLYINLLHRSGYRVLRLLCLFIMAGGIGNLIDRVQYGFVVDFFNFEWIDFPVFNVADCYITCGVFILIFCMFTIYKDDDMDVLLPFGCKKEKV